jgi:predicted nucleic acid-binding protein
VITELELLGFNGLDSNSEKELKEALRGCFVVDIEVPIKHIAIELRKKYLIKLPDAIVAATAIHLQLPFITADKDFEKIQELMLYLYKVN